MSRDWERWDEPGVADAIEAIWEESAAEKAHQEILAGLCALCIPSRDLDVLEVGCGTGRVHERLVPRLIPNERYTGVDTSERMRGIARSRFPEGRFLAGDGYRLDFANGAFDVSLAFAVLGHLPEIGPFLGELARVARRAAVFTFWPAAEGVEESHEEIRGARFLHRRYSFAYLLEQLREHLPAGAFDVEVGILTTASWAVVLRRREGTGGLALTRLFPVPAAR
ncbi:MAG: class I SAM-dependent DNA methyltransferase [Thermoanaerobaculia bacterium]